VVIVIWYRYYWDLVGVTCHALPPSSDISWFLLIKNGFSSNLAPWYDLLHHLEERKCYMVGGHIHLILVLLKLWRFCSSDQNRQISLTWIKTTRVRHWVILTQLLSHFDQRTKYSVGMSPILLVCLLFCWDVSYSIGMSPIPLGCLLLQWQQNN
jgi:hypothetical protein